MTSLSDFDGLSAADAGELQRKRIEAIENPFHKELLSHHWFILWDYIGSEKGQRLGCMIDGLDVEISEERLEALAGKYGLRLTKLMGG